MSIAINGNEISINNTQLHGMITGDENLATKLEGWEAFKNFFIKILNHLPGVSIKDKEEKFRQLYNQIYPNQEEDSDIFNNTGQLGKIWQTLENLIALMDLENARSMTFFFDDRTHDETAILHVTIAGHELPDIVLDNNPENAAIFSSIVNSYVTPETRDTHGNNDAVVYQMRHYALTVNDNQVSFRPVFKETFNSSIMVYKTIAAHKESIEIPHTIKELDKQAVQKEREIETEINDLENEKGFLVDPLWVKGKIKELKDKNESLIPCERKNNFQKRIDVLERKNQAITKLLDDYGEVEKKINSVLSYTDSWEPRIADTFEEVEQLVNQLPAGEKKSSLLRGIKNVKEQLSAVMKTEKIFTGPGELLRNMEKFPQALERLKDAARKLKKLPKGKPRTQNFATILSNDVEKALNILKTSMSKELPESRDERKVFRDSAKESFNSLKDIISSLKLPSPNKNMLKIQLTDLDSGLTKLSGELKKTEKKSKNANDKHKKFLHDAKNIHPLQEEDNVRSLKYSNKKTFETQFTKLDSEIKKLGGKLKKSWKMLMPDT